MHGGEKKLPAVAMATSDLWLVHPNAAKNHAGCFTKAGLGQESAACVIAQENRRTNMDANAKMCI